MILNTQEFADLLGVKLNTLKCWRMRPEKGVPQPTDYIKGAKQCRPSPGWSIEAAERFKARLKPKPPKINKAKVKKMVSQGFTAPGVEHIGFGEGLGGTDFQAGPAVSALFFSGGGIGGQCEAGVKLAEKKPRACLAIEYQCVFADPAEASLFGDGFFHYGGAVDKGTLYHRLLAVFLDLFGESGESFANQFVVIPAQGVA